MISDWIQTRVFITAKTYPAPAKKGIEVSCTGGITEDQRWIRLFPMPYRFLIREQLFRKYEWIDLRVTKASDARPESFTPDLESIRIASASLPTKDTWRARKDIVAPLQSRSLCDLQKERNENGYPTLGFFKPKRISRLLIKPDSLEWSEAQLARLRQSSMFNSAPTQELEKIPYTFLYRFNCENETCGGHNLSCVDWEMSQAYRKWSRSYDDWEEKFRDKFECQMIERFDTHFFVGTVRDHPASWIIVGLFYPPLLPTPTELTRKQAALF